MKRIFLIACILISGLIRPAQAQESLFTINWGIALPVGDLSLLVDKASPSGLTISGRQFINEYLAIGGYAGWQQYYSKDFGLHAVKPGLDIWGRQVRVIDTYPIMASLYLHAGDNGSPRPYFGLSTGVTFLTKYEQYGLFEFTEKSGHFTLAPEVGIYLPMGLGGGGVNLSVRYDHAFQSINDYNVQSVTFNVGLAFAR